MEQAARRLAGCEVQDDQVPGQEALKQIIAQKTGGTTQPRADERIVTLGGFTRNCFFPLHEGGTWKEETAVIRKIEIEKDIPSALGDLPLTQVDKVSLQTLLNDLAKRLSQARVQHARFYLKRSSRRRSSRISYRRIRHESSYCRSNYERPTRPRWTCAELRLVLGGASRSHFAQPWT